MSASFGFTFHATVRIEAPRSGTRTYADTIRFVNRPSFHAGIPRGPSLFATGCAFRDRIVGEAPPWRSVPAAQQAV